MQYGMIDNMTKFKVNERIIYNKDYYGIITKVLRSVKDCYSIRLDHNLKSSYFLNGNTIEQVMGNKLQKDTFYK